MPFKQNPYNVYVISDVNMDMYMYLNIAVAYHSVAKEQ